MVRWLVAAIFITFLVQMALLAFLFQERARDINQNTRVFDLSQLLDMADMAASLSPADLGALNTLVNTPYARISFVDEPPPPAPLRPFDRLLGVNTRTTEIQIDRHTFMVIDVSEALREAYGFFGQVGLIILSFFIVLTLILFRARAALNPVRRFSQAAKRLSQDLNAPPLAVEGSKELQQAARAMNRMQAALQDQIAGRTRLIAGIGHDLRTYITRLTLRADLIPDLVQREKVQRDLEEMTAVINDSLALGAAEHGLDNWDEVEVRDFIEGMVSGYVEQGKAVIMGPIAPRRLRIRSVALRRALQNLIENALRYGEQAAITATAQGSAYSICIDDAGPGISSEMREQVLKPFIRLEGSRNRDTGGTGLGLSLAQSLVLQQGGELVLEDAPTGGLRVRVTLPIPI